MSILILEAACSSKFDKASGSNFESRGSDEGRIMSDVLVAAFCDHNYYGNSDSTIGLILLRVLTSSVSVPQNMQSL